MPGDDYTSKRLTIAQKGINYELEPTLMKGMYSPYMKNMMIEKGSLKKFLGYSKLGRNPKLKSIGGSEVGCALKSFIDFNGKTRLFAFTDKTGFMAVENTINFININPGVVIEECDGGWTDAHANMGISHDASQEIEMASLKITAETTFSDADKICYKNFSSKDLTGYTHICGWVRTNFSSPGESLKLVISEAADGAKSGDYITVEVRIDDISANEWRFFCEAVDLSSMNAAVSVGIWNDASISWINQDVWIDQIRAITLLGHDYDSTTFGYGSIYTFTEAHDTSEFGGSDANALIVSPGTYGEDLLYWHKWDTPLQTLVHGIANYQKANCVLEFWNHLFIGGYVTGNPALRSLGHAALGDVDDWTSDGSGFYTLTDTKGSILRMTKNDYMMNIYSEYSISRGIWYGSYILFVFPCVMENLGLLGRNALVSTEHEDYFVGSDKRFYMMPIGQKPISIGDAVDRTVFTDEFLTKYRSYLACGNYSNKHRILFAIPYGSGSTDFPTNVYAYDIVNKLWEYFVFSHEIRDFEVSPFNTGTVSPYYREVACFIDENGTVYEIDEPATGLMDDQDIACEYQTEDVTIDDEHSNARWKWFTFTAKSSIADSTVVVQYSTDNGSTWTAFDDSPVSLTSSWVTHRIPLDVVSRVIRFRFTQTAGDLQIKANMFYGFSQDTEE